MVIPPYLPAESPLARNLSSSPGSAADPSASGQPADQANNHFSALGAGNLAALDPAADGEVDPAAANRWMDLLGLAMRDQPSTAQTAQANVPANSALQLLSSRISETQIE